MARFRLLDLKPSAELPRIRCRLLLAPGVVVGPCLEPPPEGAAGETPTATATGFPREHLPEGMAWERVGTLERRHPRSHPSPRKISR